MNHLPPLAYWVHDLSPFVIRFGDNIGIRWYGLAYVLGFLGGGWLMVRYYRAGRSALPAAQVPDFILALVAGVIIGGRVGYFLLYDFDLFVHHPLVLFRVWEGGMASHGGFVGVFLAVWWFSRRTGLPMLHLADVQASTVSVGLLLGRIANFINGELWGKITDVPWAVIFPKAHHPACPQHSFHPGTPPSCTRPAWRVSCSSPSFNGASGKATSCARNPAAFAVNTWWPTPWCGPWARSSANPTRASRSFSV